VAVRRQLTGVIEDHYAVAEEAPALFGVGRDDAGGRMVLGVRCGAWRAVLTHDTHLLSQPEVGYYVHDRP
jgi:hypothetical protein